MQFYIKKRRAPTIQIVSLIDILTILLIFFVVTTTFKTKQPEIQINLPKSSNAEESEQATEMVTIYATKDEKVMVGENTVPIALLQDVLKKKKAENPKVQFALKADTDLPLGFFVKLMDAAKDAGLGQLPFHTENPKNSP